MRVAVIGSGNVAAALARAVAEEPVLELVGICARNVGEGKQMALECGSRFIPLDSGVPVADIYLVCVSDSAVGKLSDELTFPEDAVVAHTAGGVSMDTLSSKIKHRAVIYPLQTFSKTRRLSLKEVPMFIEYSDDTAKQRMETLAGTLSDRVAFADTARRIRLHVAAVFACNFTNYLYCAAEDILKGDGMNFDILKPLIQETAGKALELSSPVEGQTGPAIRNDKATIERHAAFLGNNGYGYYEKAYELLSEAIWETLKKT